MNFFNILLYIINAISVISLIAAILIFKDTKKKKYPDKKMAGEDRPSV